MYRIRLPVCPQACGIWDSKTIDMNCSYGALIQKETLKKYYEQLFSSFLWFFCIASPSKKVYTM